ncbi:hypothetical protein JXQ31_17185 [candidate division KSB1 bacterium]|nr:hypothetical protein [candidate division KSB1 bacterium]
MGFLDNTVATGLKQIINDKIKSFGLVENLQLNSGQKRLEMTLQLRGETEPLRVMVTNFELVKSGDSTVVLIKELQTSKEWVNTLWSERIKQFKFEIPPQYASMVKFMM